INSLFKRIEKANNDIEKELYAEKIKQLEDKINELQEDKKDVINRETNTRAGYVYVISNIGSFGEDIFKIGMTRRLEPYDRIKELGDASVPFSFDVHAMIFSDDAPKLENILHKHFRDREINKVNHRKEFFRVSIDEIESVVKTNHNNTVEFIKIPQAEQYWESQNLSNNETLIDSL
ncbi:GIY-YIG nuclease family protein, partial [Staphylococcus kloosii]|uniref:GIY-YIG nuclease family protein n=1 Tax=Staphylococcus kloosii TaxID=29384 RepID=UPI000D43532A